MAKRNPAGAFRATSSFAAPGVDGLPRVVREGDLVGEDDPLVRTHRGLLQPVTEFIEQTTQGPGEKRPVRVPSAVDEREAAIPRGSHAERVAEQGEPMPHNLPPEHPDSPASTFATAQPAAGVVADDVPPEQNLAGKPTASEATAQGVGEDYKSTSDIAAESVASDDDLAQYHTGGGWYEINGVKYQGKDAAREALGG